VSSAWLMARCSLRTTKVDGIKVANKTTVMVVASAAVRRPVR
jgi:hypothetical protein